MEPIAYLDRVKIQCEILLPLYRRLRAEIGEARAAELLRAAVDEYARGVGAAAAAATPGHPLDTLRSLMPMFTAGEALEVEPLANDDETLAMNVRRCKYAEYFQALGETEFGAMITCEMDPPMTAGIGDALELQRSQTLLKGGTHCDFRWRTKDGDAGK
ncbi:MAG: L-2-amino-thiazoline-4-carboxylic acid hydrolase [Gammaproteobacteria bacterium]